MLYNIYYRNEKLLEVLVMEITIVGRGYDVSEHVKDYVEEKIGRLKRFYDNIQRAHVVINRQPHKDGELYKVEVTLYAAGKTFHAEKTSFSISEAVDTISDVLERSVRRYKEKLIKKHKIHSSKSKDLYMGIEEEEMEEENKEISWHRTIVLRPMTVAEAIEEMKLGDHKLFMFLDGDTGNVCLLYKRDDGSLGLIESILE